MDLKDYGMPQQQSTVIYNTGAVKSYKSEGFYSDNYFSLHRDDLKVNIKYDNTRESNCECDVTAEVKL